MAKQKVEIELDGIRDERPREVCGKRWTYWRTSGWNSDPGGFPCTLDAGHDGPCMMELGRAE